MTFYSRSKSDIINIIAAKEHLDNKKALFRAFEIYGIILKGMYDYYLLNYLKSDFMQQYIGSVLAGTTQKYISLAELRKIPVNFSDSQTLNKYNVCVEPMFLKIFANIFENKKLGELRDALLPKLMSGEIDVSKVEIFNEQ